LLKTLAKQSQKLTEKAKVHRKVKSAQKRQKFTEKVKRSPGMGLPRVAIALFLPPREGEGLGRGWDGAFLFFWN